MDRDRALKRTSTTLSNHNLLVFGKLTKDCEVSPSQCAAHMGNNALDFQGYQGRLVTLVVASPQDRSDACGMRRMQGLWDTFLVFIELVKLRARLV